MAEHPIRLAVCGASGRMGARITALAAEDKRFELVAGVTSKSPAGAPYRPVAKLATVISDVDAVIDFSAPEAAEPNAKVAAESGKPIVIGTTGLSTDTIATLKGFARKVPIVFSPNMSVGVNLLFELVRQAAARLAHYDIEIIEAHHNQKKDAPSGTAMRLAEVVAEAAARSESDFVYGRKGLVGPRKKKEVGISVVRAGDIVGDHTVLLCGGGERVELTHRAHSRDAFASGALQAAAWTIGRAPGFYSMKDVLGF